MPEPNLPPLHVHLSQGEENKYGLVDVPLLQESLPELPAETRIQLKNNYGLESSTVITLVVSVIYSDWDIKCSSHLKFLNDVFRTRINC